MAALYVKNSRYRSYFDIRNFVAHFNGVFYFTTKVRCSMVAVKYKKDFSEFQRSLEFTGGVNKTRIYYIIKNHDNMM